MSARPSFTRLLPERYVRLMQHIWPSLIYHIKTGNWAAIFHVQKKFLWKVTIFLFSPVGLFLVLVMRAIRPWFLVRVNVLVSERIGHFAANTELYLCERDAGINVPEGRYVDLWYHNWPVCNRQLVAMWNRVLHVGPRWLLAPVSWMNELIPGGEAHRIGLNTMHDRDVLNLLDRFPAHLRCLPDEEERGKAGLRALGIPEGAPFVCLIVRDSSYLKESIPWRSWDYHDHRDCNIQNYVLAAQKLAERGYYVVRMGAVVREAMAVDNPMIIDYAAKGLRTDFMDIYLGAKCSFCISTTTGFDAVPFIFRRPIVFVDMVPLEHVYTFSPKFLSTTKKHWLRNEKRYMTFRELFSPVFEISKAAGYERKGIDLIESTPEEIAAVVLEMEERLKGTWETTEEDEELQRRFWELLPKSTLHGEIRSRFGADFLRRHQDWLD